MICTTVFHCRSVHVFLFRVKNCFQSQPSFGKKSVSKKKKKRRKKSGHRRARTVDQSLIRRTRYQLRHATRLFYVGKLRPRSICSFASQKYCLNEQQKGNAPSGNRTRASCLEGTNSTIELTVPLMSCVCSAGN